MANQQTRRRRKRYQPGSAYAVDIKPTGVLGFLGSGRTMKIVFLIMALALVGGGAGALFGSNAFGGANSNPSSNDFVKPEDTDGTGTPQAQPTLVIRHYTGAPAMTIDPSKRYTATISTALGDVEVELFADQVPQTVNNFVFLASDGFYNGLTFHQVEAGFDAQAGDPGCQVNATGDSCRGSGDPGYDLPQEKPGTFEVGTIGMANASQFFIALTNASQFAQYTPFGRITAGLEVARQITQGTAIESITISAQ